MKNDKKTSRGEDCVANFIPPVNGATLGIFYVLSLVYCKLLVLEICKSILSSQRRSIFLFWVNDRQNNHLTLYALKKNC
jgi:hypothetical protein